MTDSLLRAPPHTRAPAVGVPRHRIGPRYQQRRPSRAIKCKIVAPSARTWGAPASIHAVTLSTLSVLGESPRQSCQAATPAADRPSSDAPVSPDASTTTRTRRSVLPSQSAGDAGRVARGAAVPRWGARRPGSADRRRPDYGPLRHPARPDLTLAGCRLARATPSAGLPVLRPFPSSTRAAATTPAEPVGARVARFPTAGSLPVFRAGRLPHRIASLRGLLGVHSRCSPRGR